MADYREQINFLLEKPERLIVKKPFTRGHKETVNEQIEAKSVFCNEKIAVSIPNIKNIIVPQSQFLKELDPNSHDVLFDENIPSFCVKMKNGGIQEIKYKRMSIPIQKELRNKQTMHLASNKMRFTLVDINPLKKQQENFIVFKQYWDLRNQDGMKYKMVDTQLSVGDAGLLYYFDYKGQIKSRILSYPEYILCPHNDQNGDRILESVYYINNDEEYIDSYDDTYMYRHTKAVNVTNGNSEWVLSMKQVHGFSEIPLITKRGDVAWNDVQPMIESYEELFNVFNAVQKRHGKGLLYIKGKFKDGGKLGDGFILNDASYEGNGDAKYLTPPSPEGMIDTLDNMLEAIQLGASTTFLLPKDVKTGGDISGITIKLVQSIDIENASRKVIEWQNVADKMVRLFKEGLAKELVNNGENPMAITEFQDLNINATFSVWEPQNAYEYNQMLAVLTGAGLLSKESGIELNTVSKPDEKERVKREQEDAEKLISLSNEINNNNIQ